MCLCKCANVRVMVCSDECIPCAPVFVCMHSSCCCDTHTSTLLRLRLQEREVLVFKLGKERSGLIKLPGYIALF